MKTLLIIWTCVLVLWTLASVAYFFVLESRERIVKQRNDDSLMLSRSIAEKKKELDEQNEVLRREKEQFKERELNLEARRASVLELEATLLNKEKELEKRINKKSKKGE